MNTTGVGLYPRVIGIHVTLPPGSTWSIVGVETLILQRLIFGALVNAGLHGVKFSGHRQFGAFSGQFFGMVPVTDFGASLRCVSAELEAVKLLDGAHLAWLDRQEGIWRTERPFPEIVPFANRIADFAAFCVAAAVGLSGPNSAQTIETHQLSAKLNETTGLSNAPTDGEL